MQNRQGSGGASTFRDAGEAVNSAIIQAQSAPFQQAGRSPHCRLCLHDYDPLTRVSHQ